MPRTPKKKGTYYDRRSEERREYQQIYYAEKREELRRGRELRRVLDPEWHAAYLEYQRQYGKTRIRNRGSGKGSEKPSPETGQSE